MLVCDWQLDYANYYRPLYLEWELSSPCVHLLTAPFRSLFQGLFSGSRPATLFKQQPSHTYSLGRVPPWLAPCPPLHLLPRDKPLISVLSSVSTLPRPP